MRTVLVYGAGNIGVCLAHYLSRYFHVGLVDPDSDALDKAKIHLDIVEKFGERGFQQENYGIEYYTETHIQNIANINLSILGVVSAAPYFCNYQIAQQAVVNKIPYFDLGGHVETSKQIVKLVYRNKSEGKSGAMVFCDLGLAPGLINFLAEHELRQFSTIDNPPDEIYMQVGGLPDDINNDPLNYSCQFSVDGLINEYFDDCQVLIDGNVTTVDGMTYNDTFVSNLSGDEYEVFHTSGGIASSLPYFKSRGIKFADYGTIRYKGHKDAILLLCKILKVDLTARPIRAAENINLLREKLLKWCPPTKEDIVVMRWGCRSYHDYNNMKCVEKELYISHTPHWTAMQLCTAIPTVAVVKMLLQEGYKNENRAFNYHDINVPVLIDNCREMGLQL